MVSRPRALAVALVLGLVGLLGGLGPLAPASAATIGGPVHATVSGPGVVATGSNSTYYLNGSGGPGVAANGSIIGNLTWTVHLSGLNTTGVSVSPSNGSFAKGTQAVTHLKTSKLPQVLTLILEVRSSYFGSNASTNVTYSVHVVTPYVVRATLVAGSKADVLAFNVTVELDGRRVGTVAIPSIAANHTYVLTYDYASLGLSPGAHTFTISLAEQHGLVKFSNGALEYSETFYVVGPPPNYGLYVLLGAVAFFGVLFIFATRVAARRRPAARR